MASFWIEYKEVDYLKMTVLCMMSLIWFQDGCELVMNIYVVGDHTDLVLSSCVNTLIRFTTTFLTIPYFCMLNVIWC
jgi:hypothetical protein